MLARLPSGSAVFIDANIFLYHFLSQSPSCTEFFCRVARREVRGVTSPAVLSEVLHHLMLAEIGERHPLTVGGALRLLRRQPELIPTLTKTRMLIQHIPRWRIQVLPSRWREVALAVELSLSYRLLTTDALIVATMRAHRLTHLASNDSDFARVPSLTLWRP